MKSILIDKVETDPLIHYGGIFNDIGTILVLHLLSFLVFIPFVKGKRYCNFLFFISSLMPVLNIYYRNHHQFVGGVFLGHLLLILGTLLVVFLAYCGFETADTKWRIFREKKILLPLILIFFLIRAVFVFGSRPTDSGIFSGVGGILYLNGSSMFRDYWGVVSIGSRYGPMLYLAYLPFVPIAYITKHLLWGDALTHWNSVSDVPLAVATSFTGALFYEGLILFILIKSFRKFGYYVALLYLLNPLNSLVLSVNANELPQTALFITGIYLLRSPLKSSLFFVLSSLMKIYPVLSALPFVFAYDSNKRKRFFFFLVLFFAAGFGYWLFEATLSPPELRTNPVRDILFYQSDPGRYHSLWYFSDILLGKILTLFVITATSMLIFMAGFMVYRKKGRFAPLRLSVIVVALLIITNRSPHPGYYYFMQTLLFYLFFTFQEELGGPDPKDVGGIP